MEKLIPRPRRAFLAAAALLLASIALPAAAQQASEAAVKAAFLYKFAGYVEWPDSAFPKPETPFVFGVVAADEVAAELEKLVPGRTINGKQVAVRRIREGEGVRGLHVLFVGNTATNARALVRAAQPQGTLTVTENELGVGAAINFVVVEDRVAFEISLEAAERSGLRISSRMLAVARRVVPRS